MALDTYYGDLFDSDAPAIGHGVNTVGAMSSGIAVQFKTRYPEMHDQYLDQCKDGDLLPGMIMPHILRNGKWVYNMATQDMPGASARYDWLSIAAYNALSHADNHGVPTIALPQIGCGVGGLNWSTTSDILENIQSSCGFKAKFEVWVLN